MAQVNNEKQEVKTMEQKSRRAGETKTVEVMRGDKKEIYCHACSEAGGADRPVYHEPPACKG